MTEDEKIVGGGFNAFWSVLVIDGRDWISTRELNAYNEKIARGLEHSRRRGAG